MKIFISWSGERSSQVAKSLAEWIPCALPNVEPWISSHDIAPGTRWAIELGSILADCQFGIICLTQENLNSPWILFEAGSLAKQFDFSRVVPYLISLKAADVKFPLAQFQGVEANQAGTQDLLRSINGLLVPSVTEARFTRVFEKWWPDLEQKLAMVSKAIPLEVPLRSDRELIEELLEITRKQQRVWQQSLIRTSSSDGRIRRQGTRAVVYWHESGLSLDEAEILFRTFEGAGITTVISRHRDSTEPDAIFIGALVCAEDAQLALRSIPYRVRYIFRPDYPTPQGGDSSGLTIGIGYMSSHYQQYRDEIAEPILVSDDDLSKLTDTNLNNTDFQALLRQLTWPAKAKHTAHNTSAAPDANRALRGRRR